MHFTLESWQDSIVRTRATLFEDPQGGSKTHQFFVNAGLGLLNFAPLRGRSLIGQVIANLARPSGNLSIRTSEGTHWVLPADVSQSWTLAVTGWYDRCEIRLLTYFAVDGSAVIDVGACFGMYTIPLARAGQKRNFHLMAFEPVPGNLKILRRNLKLNGLDDEVDVCPLALGDHEGAVTIDIESTGVGNAAVRSQTEPHHANLSSSVVIPIGRLDSQVFSRRVSCIKVDVEGLEMSVLAGAADVIDRFRPMILGEFEPYQMRNRGVEAGDLLRWAQRHNYRAFALRPIHPHAWSDWLEIGAAAIVKGDSPSWSTCLLLPDEAMGRLDDALRFANGSTRLF